MFNEKELDKHLVDSTNIEWIAYNKEKEELYVNFLGGGLYVYYKVPEELFNDFLKAGSKGRFLHMKIKNKFEYKKLR